MSSDDSREIEQIARQLLAELLEHIDDEAHVRNSITAAQLPDLGQTDLIARTALRLLVTEMLAGLQQSSPKLREFLQIAARIYRGKPRS